MAIPVCVLGQKGLAGYFHHLLDTKAVGKPVVHEEGRVRPLRSTQAEMASGRTCIAYRSHNIDFDRSIESGQTLDDR